MTDRTPDTGLTDAERTEVDRVASLLIAEWERVDGPVNASRVANFADMARVVIADRDARAADAAAEVAHWKAHAQEAGEGFARVCLDYARVSARNTVLTERAADAAQVRDRLRDLTRRLGFGDDVTEPQADNATIVRWFADLDRDASEWREHQDWLNDCAKAGCDPLEDCPVHAPPCHPAHRQAADPAREALARVYLVAPYGSRDLVRTFAADLRASGFDVTSRWLDETHEITPGTSGAATALADEAVDAHAVADLDDIAASDALVLLTAAYVGVEGGGGRHPRRRRRRQ